MPAQTSMLHVRVDDRLKVQATEALSGVGLTLSDAGVRILLTRVVAEGGLPAGLTTDPAAYDTWFRTKVQEAQADSRPAKPHAQVMQKGRALVDGKRRARTANDTPPRRPKNRPRWLSVTDKMVDALQLAVATRRSKSFLTNDAVERYLAEEEAFLTAVEAGLADAGRVLMHDDAMRYLQSLTSETPLPAPFSART